MSLREYTNSFGGPSLLVGPGARLEDVPSPFADLLTDEHRAAFANPAAYFSRLASECRVDAIAAWLRYLAEADQCKIEINIHECWKAAIVKVQGFWVLLRETVELPASGRILGDLLYSTILGNVELGYPNAGGLHEPRTVADYGLTINEEAGIPEDAVAFYTTSAGDSLINVGENAYWYSHEIHDVASAGPTADVLSTYFRHLLNRGDVRDFNFPYERFQGRL